MTMESPDHFLTNVLKSETIAQIQYAVYKLHDSVANTSAVQPLRTFERQLRKQEKFVLLDPKAAEIWVFRLVFADKTSTQTLEGASTAADDWSLPSAGGLEVVTKAVYDLQHPSDDVAVVTRAFASTTSSTVATPSTPAPPLFSSKSYFNSNDSQKDVRMVQQLAQQRSNISFSGVGSPVDTFPNLSISETMVETPVIDLSNDDRDPHVVRTKFLEAVMVSLTRQLVMTRGWIPLNFNTFVVSGARKSAHHDGSGFLRYSALDLEMPALTSIDIQMTRNGALLITPKTRKEEALGCLKSFKPVTIGESVWLAPGGTLGAFVSLDYDESSSWGTWKSHTKCWLADKGLKLDISEEWAKVKVWSEAEGFVDILWPTDLTFIRRKASSSGPKQLNEAAPATAEAASLSTLAFIRNPYLSSSSGVYGTTTSADNGMGWFAVEDSLEFAQKWLGEKQARDKEADDRIRAASITNASPDFPIKPTGYIDSQASQRDAANGAIGVYPTPPDGHPGNHETPAGMSSEATPSVKGGQEFNININGPPTAPATAEATNNTEAGDMEVDETWGVNGDKKDDTLVSSEMFGNLSGLANEFNDDLNDELFGGGEVNEDDFAFFDDDAGGDFDMMMGGGDNNDLVMPASTGVNGIPTSANPVVPAATAPDSATNLNFTFGGTDMNMFQSDRMLEDDMDLDLEDITAEMDQQLSTAEDIIINGENAASSIGLPSQSPELLKVDVKAADTEKTNEITDMVLQKPQVQTPPLSPHRALKLLLPPTVQFKEPAKPGARRSSLYSPVNFPSFVDNVDKKYMAGGRFYSTPEEQRKEQKPMLFGRTAPKPLSRRRGSRGRRPAARHVIFLNDEDDDMDRLSSETDDSTTSSDADETSADETEDDRGFEYDFDDKSVNKLTDSSSPASARLGMKRKRNSDSWDGEVSTTSAVQSPGVSRQRRLITGADETHTEYDRSLGLPPPPWDLCEPDALDFPLDGIFTTMVDARNPGSQLYLDDLQAIYNIFLEQITWSLAISQTTSDWSSKKYLDSLLDLDSTQGALDDTGEHAFDRRKDGVQHEIEETARDLLTISTTRCTLDTYVHAQDANNDAKESLGRSSDPPSIFRIPPMYVHVHRNIASGDTPIEILPPALQFWETFALAPHSGTKNIFALCLYPDASGLKCSMDIFLDRLGAVYEGCRLGSFSRAKLKHDEDGLVGIGPETVDSDMSMEDVLTAYNKSLTAIGRRLVSEITDELQNIVLFVINPFTMPSVVVNLCAGFYEAQKAYVSGVQMLKMSSPNNLVLQVVPIDLVTSKDGVLAPNQNFFIRSALEVYNRCTPTDRVNFGATFPQESYSSSIVLAKPPPKSIDFRLTSNPSPAILQENKCLHVAYSQSIDERWMVVSWTDNCGEIKQIKNYCLGRRGTNRLRPFEDACQDVWNDTEAIISKKQIHWRLLFVKAGAIEMDELDIWMRFSANASVSNTLTVLSANVSPPLELNSVLPALLPQSFTQIGSYGTPVPATPGPSQASPDQYGVGPSTPSNEAPPEIDPDTVLLDFADEVWGVVLGHCLPNAANLVEIVPSLASGYLVKRSGCSEGDDMLVMSVSLIYAASSSSTGSLTIGRSYDVLLREVLAQYRGLVTLGQHFGVIDPLRSVLPWHLAAAVKGQEAFAMCL